MNKDKLYSSDTESLFSDHLMEGEYIIWCQPTSKNASLTDRGVFEVPSKNIGFRDGLFCIAVGIGIILISLLGEKRETVDYIVCHSFMTLLIIFGISMTAGFTPSNKRGAYAITNIRAASLEDVDRLRYVYLKDVLTVQIYMLNEEKNIGLIRLFTQFDPASRRTAMIEFRAIDAPGMAEQIARKQISIVKKDNGMDEIVPEAVGEIIKTYGSRRLSRMRKRK